MKTFRRKMAAIVIIQGFLAPSGSVAAETSEMTLPISSNTSMVSPVKPAEFVEPALEVEATLDQAGAEAAALDWLQNELQMSIDPDVVALGINPKYVCIDPPFNCPANEKCPLKGGGNAICVVTDCGEGKCPFVH